MFKIPTHSYIEKKETKTKINRQNKKAKILTVINSIKFPT